jgi:hypothetical protein
LDGVDAVKRFRPPFSAVETPSGWRIVDADGRRTGVYVYGDDLPTSDLGKLNAATARGMARAVVEGLGMVAERKRDG